MSARMGARMNSCFILGCRVGCGFLWRRRELNVGCRWLLAGSGLFFGFGGRLLIGADELGFVRVVERPARAGGCIAGLDGALIAELDTRGALGDHVDDLSFVGLTVVEDDVNF